MNASSHASSFCCTELFCQFTRIKPILITQSNSNSSFFLNMTMSHPDSWCTWKVIYVYVCAVSTLVGGLERFSIFPNVRNIIPTDFHISQRGFCTTNPYCHYCTLFTVHCIVSKLMLAQASAKKIDQAYRDGTSRLKVPLLCNFNPGQKWNAASILWRGKLGPAVG